MKIKNNIRILAIARVTILFYYLSLTAFGGVLDTYVDSTRATSKLPSGFFNGENHMKEILLNTVVKTSSYYKKYSALVDDEDYEKLSKYFWCVIRTKWNIYAQAQINGKVIRMHTFITGYKMTDHRDHNGLNNQKNNLRDVTNQQNQWNRGLTNKSSSKYKGVCWDAYYNKWVVNICINNKNKNIGRFENEKQAAEVYNQWAKKLFGEFAYLNKI